MSKNLDPVKINKIIMLSTLAGTVGGMVGLGGAIVMTPFLYNYGIDPDQVTASN